MYLIRIALIVSMVSGLIYGCKSKNIEQETNQEEALDKTSANFDVILAQIKRDACYGTCPVDLITVYEDGHVEYKGVKHVRNLGTHTAQLSESQLAQLRSLMEGTSWHKLKSQYIREYVSDLPSRVLTTADDIKIRYQLDQSPDILVELDKYIYEMKDALGWSEEVTR